MYTYLSAAFYLIICLFLFSCRDIPTAPSSQPMDSAQEKAAIIQVLNDETAAAFNRDYTAWQDKWIQEDYTSKTYMDFSQNSMTETLGWEEISGFVRTYIEEHPEPAPLPKQLQDAEVRVFGTGAWVQYEQIDPERGRKRETRLMEKRDGQWKIAGMHTTIYGFEEE